MALSKSSLKIDEVAPRFAQLLSEAGTSLDTPTLEATWQAFESFSQEAVECNDEKLFFEAAVSSAKPDTFYVHLSRTCYGREPIGHIWSHELICDFVFALTPDLEAFNSTVEAEDLVEGDAESAQAREEFFQDVKSEVALWVALSQQQPIETQIYIGES